MQKLTSTWRIILLITATFALCCQRYTDSTPSRVLEGNDAANFERVFRDDPSKIEVVRSVVVEYDWRLGVVTTDDWEFELIAPRSWVKSLIREWDLYTADLNTAGGYPGDLVRDRQQHRFRAWYAPGPLDDYDTYCSRSSVPYVHVLVEKQALPDGRYRLYASKH